MTKGENWGDREEIISKLGSLIYEDFKAQNLCEEAEVVGLQLEVLEDVTSSAGLFLCLNDEFEGWLPEEYSDDIENLAEELWHVFDKDWQIMVVRIEPQTGRFGFRFLATEESEAYGILTSSDEDQLALLQSVEC